jgi:hypothetical protein
MEETPKKHKGDDKDGEMSSTRKNKTRGEIMMPRGTFRKKNEQTQPATGAVYSTVTLFARFRGQSTS